MMSKEHAQTHNIDNNINHCRQWQMFPGINPLTNRRILANGPTYQKLQSACRSKRSTMASASIQEPFSSNNIILPCYIRKCSHIKYKTNIMKASPSRKRLFNAVRPANTSTWTGMAYGAYDALCGRSKVLSQVGQFYDRWNICEAPASLDFSHVAANTLYMYMAEYLHVLYGDVIIPGMMYIDNRNNFKWYSEFVSKPASGHESFADVIDRATIHSSKPRMHTALVIIESLDGVDAHAMVLVFNKDNGKKWKNSKNGKQIALEIIDPYMQHESEHVTRLTSFLNSNNKDRKFIIAPHHVNKNLHKTFQSAESMMEMSSLDFWGYCGVWTILMMELIAAGVRDSYTSSSTSAQDIIANWVPFKSASPAVWRKLALDYIFSRITDLYAVSAIFMYTHVHSFLETYVTRYVDMLNEQDVYNAIMKYIPWFDEVHERLP